MAALFSSRKELNIKKVSDDAHFPPQTIHHHIRKVPPTLDIEDTLYSYTALNIGYLENK
jgi:hypothetical protein